VSGLGGWGDLNTHFNVPDGGFHRLQLSYPSPHIVRRNFTLLPYDFPSPFFTNPLIEGNSTFTVSVIESILETSAGDYKSFQTSLEAFEVGPRFGIRFSYSDVTQGPHSGVHLTVNG
jgi:tyrosinase